MTTVAAHFSSEHKSHYFDEMERPIRRLKALLRLWRRHRTRRHHLAVILHEMRDPKMLEDVGIGPLPRSGLEDVARAMMHHCQH